ncbi:hypothetical protein [Aquimarina longa]|uniref:hypothetical protein n=1 Tax=Aquimarina longa TaxID=1080221 RepID=UPI000784B142|nr:hypothetical protein [Aquimarina longa]
MHKLKLPIAFLTGIFILISCSNDDSDNNNDIIIGKWKAIEKYESNQIIDLEICKSFIYVEYKADNWIEGGRIISDNFPEECQNILFELGWNWKNLGDNKYQIRYLEERGQIFTFYKNGANLVEENPDGITKIIYEPY